MHHLHYILFNFILVKSTDNIIPMLAHSPKYYETTKFIIFQVLLRKIYCILSTYLYVWNKKNLHFWNTIWLSAENSGAI